VQPYPEVGTIFKQTNALDWLDHIAESNSVVTIRTYKTDFYLFLRVLILES
jgi:hypothetical protein